MIILKVKRSEADVESIDHLIKIRSELKKDFSQEEQKWQKTTTDSMITYN